MTGFYRQRFAELRSNAQALRQAQLKLIEAGKRGETAAADGEDPEYYATFDNPYFWAPFVVTADIIADDT